LIFATDPRRKGGIFTIKVPQGMGVIKISGGNILLYRFDIVKIITALLD
jgi:hypothetical protein